MLHQLGLDQVEASSPGMQSWLPTWLAQTQELELAPEAFWVCMRTLGLGVETGVEPRRSDMDMAISGDI